MSKRHWLVSPSTTTAPPTRKSREDDIVRDILSCIDDSGEVNQRALSKEPGIPLGMTNAYMRR